MQKPKILRVFDNDTKGTAYSKLNNTVNVSKSENTIVVDPSLKVANNTILTFIAPCDCSAVIGIVVNDKLLTFRDANFNDVSELDYLFSSGASVDVRVDIDGGYAYIQNADTNAYIEKNFTKKSDAVGKKTSSGGEIFNDYTNNKAYAQYSKVEGSHNTAGISGFYIADISFDENPIIRLQVYGTDVLVTQYGLDKKLTIILDSAKYHDCATIIGYDGNDGLVVDQLPFSSTEGLTESAYLYVLEDPTGGNTYFGRTAHAEGHNTRAVGAYSHSEGANTLAASQYAHAEGDKTRANFCGHAEGYQTYAKSNYSHAEGQSNTAAAQASHVEGRGNITEGIYSHAEGFTTSTGPGADAAHAEGETTKATAKYSHSEGKNTEASGQAAHAEGQQTTASAFAAHSEGYYSKATGAHAHAEGYNTKAEAENGHAEGSETKVTGLNGHAEGSKSQAIGENSHAEGLYTRAGSADQHVQGRHNVLDSAGKFAHIVGGGTSATTAGRKNIHTVDWEGNAWYRGVVKVGGTSDKDAKTVATENYVDTKVSEGVRGLATEEYVGTKVKEASDAATQSMTEHTSASNPHGISCDTIGAVPKATYDQFIGNYNKDQDIVKEDIRQLNENISTLDINEINGVADAIARQEVKDSDTYFRVYSSGGAECWMKCTFENDDLSDEDGGYYLTSEISLPFYVNTDKFYFVDIDVLSPHWSVKSKDYYIDGEYTLVLIIRFDPSTITTTAGATVNIHLLATNIYGIVGEEEN